VDITELKRIEQELRISQERVEGIIATAMDAIITIDDEQRIVLFNAAAEKMLRCQARDGIGSPIDRFIPERFRAAHCAHVRHFGEAGYTTRTMGPALWGLRADGEEFPIEATISQMETGGRKLFTVIIRDITERLRAEEALKRSEEHCRELVLRSPMAMAVVHLPESTTELVNLKFIELFGYTMEDVPDIEHWWPLAYPDVTYREAIKAEWTSRVEKALSSHAQIEPMEATVHCKDGSSRRIEFHFASLGDTGLISFVDLTARQRAEAELRESEERFRLMANTAPVMIWASGVDKLCTFFNRPWLDFTGRSLEAELGNGWAEGVHSEDLRRCLDTYTKSFDRREPFQMEYRIRRHDGEYHWILDTGVARYNADGSFAGYIGSCIDVTERKLAEEALSTLGRRLIEAQEEERTRIARELHDDINQRLALLAISLDGLKQNLPAAAVGLEREVEAARQQAQDLSTDVAALSRRLHSSKLDHLGLVATAASLIRELSLKQGVEIDFQSEGIPKDLSKEISLCLFRVLQEALQNAIKHSGSRRFQVLLNGGSSEIQLTVRDSGIGFDPRQATKGRGLGLTSMKERLKLVDGDLSIDSQSEHGTTIHARVPLCSGIRPDV